MIFVSKGTPDFYLSEHFHTGEFRCPCCGFVIIKEQLISGLEVLRSMIGDIPITVHSGYRCPEHNQAVRGFFRSQHMLGLGADVSALDWSPEELWPYAKSNMIFGGLGLYKGHVHVDVRQERVIWYDK